MASSTDVLTYIGIPLAVLGVLPIFYAFSLSAASTPSSYTMTTNPLTFTGPYRFLPLSNRGRSRRSDGTGFITGSSPMTSQVEVELPIFTIALLERSSELYQKLDTTMLFIKASRGEPLEHDREGPCTRVSARRKLAHVSLEELVVGRKLYRI